MYVTCYKGISSASKNIEPILVCFHDIHSTPSGNSKFNNKVWHWCHGNCHGHSKTPQRASHPFPPDFHRDLLGNAKGSSLWKFPHNFPAEINGK